MDVETEAKKLIAQGYRRTSNRYRMVSRIDHPDWITILAKHLHRSPAELYVPGEDHVSATWCDHYRRVLSKDTLEGLPEEVFKLIPGSGWDPCGYCEKDT